MHIIPVLQQVRRTFHSVVHRSSFPFAAGEEGRGQKVVHCGLCPSSSLPFAVLYTELKPTAGQQLPNAMALLQSAFTMRSSSLSFKSSVGGTQQLQVHLRAATKASYPAPSMRGARPGPSMAAAAELLWPLCLPADRPGAATLPRGHAAGGEPRAGERRQWQGAPVAAGKDWWSAG